MDCDFFKNLVESGVFGNYKLVEAKEEKDQHLSGHYSSIVRFYTLICSDGTVEEKFDIVVKTQLLNPAEREIRDCNQMFHNEISMYQKIVPEICRGDQDFFPKLIYAFDSNGQDIEKDVIVLENLRAKGFSPSRSAFLDCEHLEVVVKVLAKFHSYSYEYKKKDACGFVSMVEGLKETWYRDDLPRNIMAQSLASLKRGVEPLTEKGPDPGSFADFLCAFEDLFKTVGELKKPKEPLAVLCHGDLVPSNILFRYDDEGRPTEVRLLDLQSSTYSSPALDLAKLLCVGTDPSIGVGNVWDRLVDLYWEGLTFAPGYTYIPGSDQSWQAVDKAAFTTELGQRAPYGFLVASFAVPMMMPQNEVEMASYAGLTDEEKSRLVLRSGGRAADQVLQDMLLYMYTKGYIQSFLNAYAGNKGTSKNWFAGRY